MLNRIRRGLRWLLHEFGAAAWDVIKLPFWLVGEGFRRLAAMGWKRLTLLGVAAIVVTIVAMTVMVKATSQPGFCKSCHVMRPYFEAWQTSTHSHIECVTCHVPPGVEGTIKHKFMALSMVANYFTGVYKRSKPWAEIEDASCLQGGCHETRLLKGTENFKGVAFDHTPHLTQPRRDRQLRCTSCHAQIVQGEHITVTETTCFLCHFKPDTAGNITDLARCTHCHRPPTGAAAADTAFDHTRVLETGISCQDCHAGAVAGDGFVPKDRCNTCHAQLEHIERYDDMEFVHQKHVTEHKVECTNCHIAIRHGRQAFTKADDPVAQCGACHQAEAAVWRGELPGLPKTPSLMARVGMTCSSCHVQPHEVTAAGTAHHPVCTPCHEGGYDALWPQWNAPLLRTVDGMLAEARRIPGSEGAELEQALALYREGLPAHDPDLILVLREKLGGDTAHDNNACASCHPGAAEAAPVWGNTAVPHRPHVVAGLACEQCHESTREHHGHVKITGVDCNACHHKSVAAGADCATCHKHQQNVYTGKLAVPGAAPSAMAAAEVGCGECHTSERGLVRRVDVSACVGCHDAAYADSLRLWQRRGDDLETRVKARMAELNRASDLYRRYADLETALVRDGSRSAHHPALFNEWMQRLERNP